MKTLTGLKAECATLGIAVKTNGRASKGPYITALRDHHWRKDHPDEPPPPRIPPMLLGSWEDLDEAQAHEIEEDCHAWIIQEKLDGVRVLLHVEGDWVRISSRVVSDTTYRLSELEANLVHLIASLSKLSGAVLDGELLCPAAILDTGSTTTTSSLQAPMAILATSAYCNG